MILILASPIESSIDKVIDWIYYFNPNKTINNPNKMMANKGIKIRFNFSIPSFIPFKTIQEAIAYWEEQEVLIKKNNGYIVVDLQEKELNKLYSPRLTSTPENALSNAKNQYRAKAIEDINNTCFQGMMSPSWYNDIDLWKSKFPKETHPCCLFPNASSNERAISSCSSP